MNINPRILRHSFVVNALSKYDLQSVSYTAGLTSPLSSYNYISEIRDDRHVSSTYDYINPNDIDIDRFKYKINTVIKDL